MLGHLSYTIHECQISPLTVHKRQAQCSPSDHKAIDEELVLLAWICGGVQHLISLVWLEEM